MQQSAYFVLFLVAAVHYRYVEVDESNGVHLFYYFVRSERSPGDDPLMLWLTGGPGCSVLTALAYEIGMCGCATLRCLPLADIMPCADTILVSSILSSQEPSHILLLFLFLFFSYVYTIYMYMPCMCHVCTHALPFNGSMGLLQYNWRNILWPACVFHILHTMLPFVFFYRHTLVPVMFALFLQSKRKDDNIICTLY